MGAHLWFDLMLTGSPAADINVLMELCQTEEIIKVLVVAEALLKAHSRVSDKPVLLALVYSLNAGYTVFK